MPTLVLESWFAVQVAPRHEKKVASILSYKGYEQFVPTYESRRIWTDRSKMIELPLFPGYVFCKITHKAVTGLVIATPGVVRVVGFSGRPYPIPDHEIDAIRKFSSFPHVSPVPYLKVGQKVRINSGPLSGITGILAQIKNRHRVVVSVDLIMKSIAVDVDVADVHAVSEPDVIGEIGVVHATGAA